LGFEFGRMVTPLANSAVLAHKVSTKNKWTLSSLTKPYAGRWEGWTLTQNAYIERYNRTVRYDWLAQYLFSSIDEVQEFATRWLWTYNNERPNRALGGLTPKQRLALSA